MKLGIVVPMIYLPSIENSAVVLLLLLLFPLHLELKIGKLYVGAHFHWIKVCWNCKVRATAAWNKSCFNKAHTEEAGWVRASQACSFPPSVIHGVMLGRPEEPFFKIWLAFFWWGRQCCSPGVNRELTSLQRVLQGAAVLLPAQCSPLAVEHF